MVKVKKLKIPLYACPACSHALIKKVLGDWIMPKYECKNCGYTGPIFIKVETEEELMRLKRIRTF